MKKALLVFVLCAFVCLSFNARAQGWKWTAGSTCTPNVDGLIDSGPIVVDNSGNVYESGIAGSYGTAPFQSTYGPFTVVDSFNQVLQGILVSTDQNGAYRWAIGTQNGFVAFTNICIDPYADIYVFGECGGYFTLGAKSFTGSFFCAKVNTLGQVVWIKDLAPEEQTLSAIAVSSNGDLFAAGTFQGHTFTIGATTLTNTDPSGASADVFFAKYDSSGNPLWAKSFGGIDSDYVSGLAVTNNNELYIAGSFTSPTITIGASVLTGTGFQPNFLAKFGSNGNPLWARNDVRNTFALIDNVTADAAGSAYIMGAYEGTFYFGNDTFTAPTNTMFLAKYDSAGNEKWGRSINDVTDIYDAAADACGNIWVCGPHAVDFNSLLDPMTIAEYDSAGHLADTLQLSSGGDDYSGVAVDNSGYLYVGGDYYGSRFIVGADTFLTQDTIAEYLFVSKYKYETNCFPAGISPTEQTPESGIILYPNPAAEECILHSDLPLPANARAEIYDVSGRLIRAFHVNESNTVIPLTGLPDGLYQFKIYATEGAPVNRKLVIVR